VIKVDKLIFSIDEKISVHGCNALKNTSMNYEVVITKEHTHHIELGGGITLTGEYITSWGSEGLNVYFPVEITIPKKRVAAMEEVFFSIPNYECVREDESKLFLNCDVEITGMIA
jgi:hypothetical protein